MEYKRPITNTKVLVIGLSDVWHCFLRQNKWCDFIANVPRLQFLMFSGQTGTVNESYLQL